KLLRPLLFSFDSESVHHVAIKVAKCAQALSADRLLEQVVAFRDPFLHCSAFGCELENPLGLAAGFDKQVEMVPLLSALGFGHVEVGTITPEQQVGNPRPRIFRLPADRALINRMGFPSDGLKSAKRRLEALSNRSLSIRVAANIGKNKDTPLESATEDYAKLARELSLLVNWLTVNVSSPNTPGLRSLQTRESLAAIVTVVRESSKKNVPILVKLSPDLTDEEVEDIVPALMEHRVDGIVASNTTLSRDGLKSTIEEAGGLSGCPLFHRTRSRIRQLVTLTRGEIPIIAVGGVSTWEEFLTLIVEGARLVQVYTAFIYEGPGWPSYLLREATRFCKSQGLTSINEAKGNSALLQLLNVES
ncbi:MAG: quinone-dependent dihydroorotate dehydrogenase, partial [Bdellovibrionales bacterium]|nr:quinone-dependent dihydroorotate dehydrogenase [Bdellovibrionales bacterium]